MDRIGFEPQPTGVPCASCGEEIVAYNEAAFQVMELASEEVRKHMRCRTCHESARRANEAAEIAGDGRAGGFIGYQPEGS